MCAKETLRVLWGNEAAIANIGKDNPEYVGN
jgi:hypothetical protein